MKLRLPLQLAAAILACFAQLSPSSASDTLSIKFGENGTNMDGSLIFGEGGSSDLFFGNTSIGMEAVSGKDWFLCTDTTGSKKMANGPTVAWNSLCDWYVDAGNDFLDRWLGESKDIPTTINVSGIDMLQYTVYIVYSTDNGSKWFAPLVNGQYYSYDEAGNLVESDAAWGQAGSRNDIVLKENTIAIGGLTGDLSIIGGYNNNEGKRGGIAGIQIVDSYEGTVLHRITPAGTAAWTAAEWSDTSGSTGSLAWGTGKQAAFIYAHAEGSTLTLDGTISTDGLILKSGSLALSGGRLNMTGPSMLQTAEGTTLDLSATTFNNELVLSGNGSVIIDTISSTIKVTGGTLKPGTLHDGSQITITELGSLGGDSVKLESGAKIILSDNNSNAFTFNNISGDGTLLLIGATVGSWATDNRLTNTRTEIRDRESVWLPGGSFDAEKTYSLGRNLYIYSGSSLKLKFPAVNDNAHTISSALTLQEGGTLYGGVGWDDDRGGGANMANINFVNGITIEATAAADDVALIYLSSGQRGLLTSKLNGSGTIKLERVSGISYGGSMVPESSLVITGADDDETRRFSGKIQLTGVDGEKKTHLILNHQLAAEKALISLQGAFSGLSLGVAESTIAGLESVLTGAEHITVGITSGSTLTDSALTINYSGKDTLTYAGTVLAGISINKTGTGTQVLSGDMSAFNGTLTASEGELILNNFTGRGMLAANGGKLILDGSGTFNANATGTKEGTFVFRNGSWKLYISSNKTFDAGTFHIEEGAMFRTTSLWKHHLNFGSESKWTGTGTFRFDVPETQGQYDGFRNLTLQGSTAGFTGTLELLGTDWDANQYAYRTMLYLDSADNTFGGIIKTVGISKSEGGDTSIIDDSVTPNSVQIIVQRDMSVAGLEGQGGLVTGDETIGTVDLIVGDAANHTFGGSIGTLVNIVKAGEGTHFFTGDMSSFNGIWEARAGILDISGATHLGTAATEYRLAGGQLKVGDSFTLSAASTLSSSAASAGSLIGNMVLDGGTVTVLNDTTETPQYIIDGNLTLGTGTAPKVVLDLNSLFSLAASNTPYVFTLFQSNNNFTGLTLDDIETKGLIVDNTSRDSLSFAQGTLGGKYITTMSLTKSAPVTLTWTGNGSLWQTKNGQSSWTADIASADTGFFTGDKVIFTADASSKSVSITGTVKPRAMEIQGGDYVFNAGTEGTITGDGALTLNSGSLSINLANAGWKGSIDVKAGELKFAQDGLGTGKITLNNGTMLSWLAGNQQDVSSRLNWEEDSHITLNIAGADDKVTFGTSIANKAHVTKLGNGTMILNGSARITGSLTIGTKNLSGGIVSMTGGGSTTPAAVKGAIDVVNGILSLDAVSMTGWGEAANNVSSLAIRENGEVRFTTSDNQTFTNLTVTMEGGTLSGSTGRVDFYGQTTQVKTLASSKESIISTQVSLRQDDNIFDIADGAAANDLLVSGNFITTGGEAVTRTLIKLGAGTMNISGQYNIAKGIEVRTGKLILSNADAKLAATEISIHKDAVLTFNTMKAEGYNYGGILSAQGADATEAGTVETAAGTKLALSGNNSAFNGTLQIASNAALTLLGDMGAANLRGDGALLVQGGTTVISGNNDGDSLFSGTITITNGTLRAGTDTALGNGDINLQGGTLDLTDKALANKIIATGGTISGNASASIGDVVARRAFSTTGTLSVASLSMDAGITVSAANLTSRGGLTLGTGALLATTGNLTLAEETTISIDALNLTRDDASITVSGNLSVSGNGSVSIKLGDDFMSNNISEGNYTILSVSGGLDPNCFVAGTTLGGTLWDDVSDVYEFNLVLSDDKTKLYLHAGIDNNKAWQWKGASSGTWSNTSAEDWKDKETGPEGKAVFFGAESPLDQTIHIDETGVNPVFVQIQSNASYTFTGGAISDYTGAGNTKPTALMMAGTGTVILQNANTFSGDVTLNKGTVVIQNANALGKNGAIIFNNGTLEFGNNATDISSRFIVNENKLKLAVSENVSITLANLATGIRDNAQMLLTKSGAGNLTLAQSFAGDMHITDAATEEAGIRIRRSDSGGSLTLQGASYKSVTIDSLNTLIIDGSSNNSLTLANMAQGDGRILINAGKKLSIASAGRWDGKLELHNGATLSLTGSANTLSGGVTVNADGGQATINAGGSTIGIAGKIGGLAEVDSQPGSLMLHHGTFDLSASTVEDNVHIILGNGTNPSQLLLGTEADSTLRLANFTSSVGSTVSGTEGQTLELVEAELSGSLTGGFTIRVDGEGLGKTSVILKEGISIGEYIGFVVSGGTLDLAGLALQNDITLYSGSLTNASNWDSHVSIDTSAGPDCIALGDIKASAIKKIVTSDGSTVQGIGHGTIELDTANLTLGVSNTKTYTASTDAITGDGITVINFGSRQSDAQADDRITLSEGTKLCLNLGDDLKENVLDQFAVNFDKEELLPDYGDSGDKINRLYFTITNGRLDVDPKRIDFDPLLKIWGLKVAGIDGGSIIADGNLSVWRTSKEGHVSGYEDMNDYRAVYLDRDMNITLPGSDDQVLTIKYASGKKGCDLTINSDGTGTARVQFYNNRDRDGNLVHSTIAGKLQSDEHTAISKTGEATLSIGGDISIAGSLSIEEGGMAFTRNDGEHTIGRLSISKEGKLTISGAESIITVNTLESSAGTIQLGGDSILRIASGSIITGSIQAIGDKDETGTLELGEGTILLRAQNALAGINLTTAYGTNLDLDTKEACATINNWNGLGTLAGEGSLTITGQASYRGTLADFSGQIAVDRGELTLGNIGNKAASLSATGGASLTLDYTEGEAAYANITIGGASRLTLIAGNGSGTNNTLTLTRGGSISGDSTLGFVLNTEADGSLSPSKPLITTGGQEHLTMGDGATIHIAAGNNQHVINGTMPMQIALASHVIQQGGVQIVFDELFGKYFDPTQSHVETINGTMILTTTASSKGFYIHHAKTEVAQAGAQLMDMALITINPQTSDKTSTLAALLNTVDASIKAHDAAGASRAMAASAGSTVTSLLGSLQSDFRYQQTLLRNRMTTMGLPSGYSYGGALPLWNTWMQATGSYNCLNGDGDNAGYQYNTWGGTFGVDANFTPGFTAGIAMTASYGKLTSNSADSLSGDMDNYYVNLFGRYQRGKWGHNFILTAGWSQGDAERTVPLGQYSYAGHSETSGNTWGAMYEATYDISLDENNSSILQPLVNISLHKSSIDDYNETGAGNAGLAVRDMDATTATISAGIRWMGLMGGNLFGRESLAELRMQVSQDMGDTQNEARVGFQGNPGFSQNVKGSKMGTTGLQIGAGISIPSGEQGTVFMEANADIRSRMTSASGSIGYRYNF